MHTAPNVSGVSSWHFHSRLLYHELNATSNPTRTYSNPLNEDVTAGHFPDAPRTPSSSNRKDLAAFLETSALGN